MVDSFSQLMSKAFGIGFFLNNLLLYFREVKRTLTGSIIYLIKGPKIFNMSTNRSAILINHVSVSG